MSFGIIELGNWNVVAPRILQFYLSRLWHHAMWTKRSIAPLRMWSSRVTGRVVCSFHFHGFQLFLLFMFFFLRVHRFSTFYLGLIETVKRFMIHFFDDSSHSVEVNYSNLTSISSSSLIKWWCLHDELWPGCMSTRHKSGVWSVGPALRMVKCGSQSEEYQNKLSVFAIGSWATKGLYIWETTDNLISAQFITKGLDVGCTWAVYKGDERCLLIGVQEKHNFSERALGSNVQPANSLPIRDFELLFAALPGKPTKMTLFFRVFGSHPWPGQRWSMACPPPLSEEPSQWQFWFRDNVEALFETSWNQLKLHKKPVETILRHHDTDHLNQFRGSYNFNLVTPKDGVATGYHGGCRNRVGRSARPAGSHRSDATSGSSLWRWWSRPVTADVAHENKKYSPTGDFATHWRTVDL